LQTALLKTVVCPRLCSTDRLLKHRVQLEILDKLRRLYNVAEHMAISVLPRSVLVGELSA